QQQQQQQQQHLAGSRGGESQYQRAWRRRACIRSCLRCVCQRPKGLRRRRNAERADEPDDGCEGVDGCDECSGEGQPV
ncbi:hypothetical protein E4U41_004384, partial [Claviceps citrina]